MNLEHELRRALKRKNPPSGFDDRVLSRIAASETVPTPATTRRWPRVALPVAASLMLAVGGTYYTHNQQERQARERLAQTEHAAREVVLALQIASETIVSTQAKIEEITRHDATNTQ
jgi:hypothetical protein